MKEFEKFPQRQVMPKGVNHLDPLGANGKVGEYFCPHLIEMISYHVQTCETCTAGVQRLVKIPFVRMVLRMFMPDEPYNKLKGK